MNRNTEQHFATNPTVGIARSKFDRSHTHKTSFNAADLIPIYVDCTIMPGDTVKMRQSEVIRMATPAVPVMDNCWADIYWFFTPYRLIWDHWRQFMGENDTAPWIQQNSYEIPQIVAPTNSSGGWTQGSLADYFGYPKKKAGYKATALPFRAYALIWNEWFRDQNLKNPIYISMGDSDITGKDLTESNYDYVTDTEKGARPAKVAKPFDYFTACLPGAQKGPAVQVPIGQYAPVIGAEPIKHESGFTTASQLVGEPLRYDRFASGTGQGSFYASDDDTGTTQMANGKDIAFVADLSNAVGATVNQLRQAFAIQKFYERQAMGGTRYIEMIKAHFDVTNPDFRMQRPEYLGGKRVPINMNQVIQTSENGTTPQGNAGAYSVTSDVDEDVFTHSFTEHGILMGLVAIRTTHTYQQGLNAQFSKKKMTDFYFPEFANLGNMAVLNKEIYLQGPNVVDSDGRVIDELAFGYQEAWATERYFPDIITGELNSTSSAPLDSWHYGDYYQQQPYLSSEWIDETQTNIARSLAVRNHDQFIADFYFGAIYTRPMPMYSIPGLIDHH